MLYSSFGKVQIHGPRIIIILSQQSAALQVFTSTYLNVHATDMDCICVDFYLLLLDAHDVFGLS